MLNTLAWGERWVWRGKRGGARAEKEASVLLSLRIKGQSKMHNFVFPEMNGWMDQWMDGDLSAETLMRVAWTTITG